MLQVYGEAVAYGNRGTGQQHFQRLRAADNIGCTHNHHFFAAQLHAVSFQ